jgi:hypothetical protein
LSKDITVDFLVQEIDRGNNFVYYESIKRDLKIKPMYEYRCDERLKTKDEEFTHLGYTGLLGGLEHLKIETRLIDREVCEWDGWVCDLDVNEMGEYVT